MVIMRCQFTPIGGCGAVADLPNALSRAHRQADLSGRHGALSRIDSDDGLRRTPDLGVRFRRHFSAFPAALLELLAAAAWARVIPPNLRLPDAILRGE